MSIEAMKQALNALDYYASFATGKERGFTFPIITALRQAIEQAEKQEPVAYVAVINGEIDWNADYPFSNEPFTCFDDENAVPLYTSPPRKEWVGLTDEDWANIPDFQKEGCELDGAIYDWVEARLKEKNT